MLSSGRVIAAIPVSDLDRAKAFYGGTLGLEAISIDLPASQLYKCGLGSYLVIYEGQNNPGQHVATFLVDGIEEDVAAMRARGVTFEEYDLPGLKTVNGIAAVGPIRGAWCKDPDGNVLGVVHLETAI